MGVSPDPLLHHEGPRTHPSCVCSLCQEHQDPVISSSHRAGARLLRWKSRASRTNQALNRSFPHHDREWTHRDSGAKLISRRKSPRELRFIWTLSWKASSPSPSLVWRSMAFTLGLDYDADHLLNLADPILCPDHFPEGQACALPLLPGLYGGGDPLVIGPLDDIPDAILPFLKGVIYAEATLTSAAGDKLACIWVRAAVDHS